MASFWGRQGGTASIDGGRKKFLMDCFVGALHKWDGTLQNNSLNLGLAFR
jgi:hypothetical protein